MPSINQKILFVQTDPPLNKIAIEKLLGEYPNTAIAQNAEEALEQMQKEEFDFVVTGMHIHPGNRQELKFFHDTNAPTGLYFLKALLCKERTTSAKLTDGTKKIIIPWLTPEKIIAHAPNKISIFLRDIQNMRIPHIYSVPHESEGTLTTMVRTAIKTRMK